MIYPYFLMEQGAEISPVIKLKGRPLHIILDDDMCTKALELKGDSVRINEWFDSMMADAGCSWAVGAYLEDREPVLSKYPQMEADKRYFHLGIDICAPAGTPVFAPFDGVVEESGYEEGEGNYGGYVILKHSPAGCEPFYLLFGHMAVESLPETGRVLKAGEQTAVFGDIHENGGWNWHTHIQVITESGREKGYFMKGYCSEKELKVIDSLCPSPVPLLTAGAVI